MPTTRLSWVSALAFVGLVHCGLDGLSGGAPIDGGGIVDAGDALDAGPSPRDASSDVEILDSKPLIVTPEAGFDCSVHADAKLYCTNAANAAMYATPHFASAVVNHLRMTYSYFDCWGPGDLHPGGSTTWYRTVGDDNLNQGWLPAVDLNTPDAFDANPTARGLMRCP